MFVFWSRGGSLFEGCWHVKPGRWPDRGGRSTTAKWTWQQLLWSVHPYILQPKRAYQVMSEGAMRTGVLMAQVLEMKYWSSLFWQLHLKKMIRMTLYSPRMIRQTQHQEYRQFVRTAGRWSPIQIQQPEIRDGSTFTMLKCRSQCKT